MEELDGKVYLHEQVYWETGSKWWSISTFPANIIFERGDGYMLRADVVGDIVAGPFDTLEAAYAAYEVMYA